MRKQGIFGGTFDPPHFGHLLGAQGAIEMLGLDCVRFVLAAAPPHKQDETISPAHVRLAMVQAAVEGNTSFIVDSRELGRSGPSYTVETVRELRREFPGDELTLIIGADNSVDFRTWKNPEEILSLAAVAVIDRPGFAPAPEGEHQLRRVRVPLIGISSTEIRKRVREGKSIRYLVPGSVAEIIQKERLYK